MCSCHSQSILECLNLFSGVKQGIRLFCFIFVLTGHTKLGTRNFHFQAERAESTHAYQIHG